MNNDLFKNGFIFIEQPRPFRHRQLSLKKQHKDINIKQKKEELQKKVQEHLCLQKKYTSSHAQFKRYQENRRKDNIELLCKQQKLKNELFKLSIRRDQIQARINYSITLQKAATIKKYLKCITYSVGKRFDLIKYCRSEKIYTCMHFLLKFILNRFFRDQPIQQSILRNMAKIVYCKKILFQSQWIMLVLKEQYESNSSDSLKTNSINITIHQCTKNKYFLLNIYSITGKYFSIEKRYSQAEIKDYSSNTFVVHRNSHHRLSVADNLQTQLTRFHVINQESKNFTEMNLQSQAECKSKNTFKSLKPNANGKSEVKCQSSDQLSASYKANQNNSLYTHQEFDEEKSCQSDQHQNSNTFNEGENQLISNSNITNSLKKNNSGKKKTCSIKQKSCLELRYCKINKISQKQFQLRLFPQANPILNIIILKSSKQVYFLQEYMKRKQKKLILQKSIARFKLKYQLTVQNKKNIYFKVIHIDKFYENILGLQEYIKIGFLLTLKCYQVHEYAEIYLHCDSINSHSRVQKAISLKILIHRETIYKEQAKEQFTASKRVHNLKILKSSSLKKGRQSKRYSGMKNSRNANMMDKNILILTAYKAYTESCKANPSKMIQKLNLFLKSNVMSLQKRNFVSEQFIKKAIFNLIRVQNKIKRFICEAKYLISKQQIKNKVNLNEVTRILISVNSFKSNQVVKVSVENIAIGKYQILRIEHLFQNYDLIFSIVDKYKNQKQCQETFQDLCKIINQKIQEKIERIAKKQRQKPEKNKRILNRFFHMLNLRGKARKNIFFIKKIAVKEHKFVLIVRRDRYLSNILQCTLTDIYSSGKELLAQESTSKLGMSVGKELKSEQLSNHQNLSQVKKKYHKYQKIYIMEQYFKSMDKKNIISQFYIDKGVFILKPISDYNVYFIERLACININSEEFNKQLALLERMESNKIKNTSAANFSNKQLRKTNKPKSKEQLNSSVKYNIKLVNSKQNRQHNRKNDKKTSIDLSQDILNYVKNTFLKGTRLNNSGNNSKKSLADLFSKGKNYYKIFENIEQEQIYYSFYKQQNIFFVIDYFTLKRTRNGAKFNQQTFRIHRQVIQKQELTENNLLVKKLVRWMYEQKRILRNEKNLQSQINIQSYKNHSATMDNNPFMQNSERYSQFNHIFQQNPGKLTEQEGSVEHSYTKDIRIPIPHTESQYDRVQFKLDISHISQENFSFQNLPKPFAHEHFLLSIFQ